MVAGVAVAPMNGAFVLALMVSAAPVGSVPVRGATSGVTFFLLGFRKTDRGRLAAPGNQLDGSKMDTLWISASMVINQSKPAHRSSSCI